MENISLEMKADLKRLYHIRLLHAFIPLVHWCAHCTIGTSGRRQHATDDTQTPRTLMCRCRVETGHTRLSCCTKYHFFRPWLLAQPEAFFKDQFSENHIHYLLFFHMTALCQNDSSLSNETLLISSMMNFNQDH